MDEERIDNGWDTFCSRAAGAQLLRLAVDLWERAGARFPSLAGVKAEPAEVRALLERRAHALMMVVNAGELNEAAFAEALSRVGGLDAEAITAAVQLVKERARPLRGQLDLFAKLTQAGGT